jgi:hypothetical protein
MQCLSRNFGYAGTRGRALSFYYLRGDQTFGNQKPLTGCLTLNCVCRISHHTYPKASAGRLKLNEWLSCIMTSVFDGFEIAFQIFNFDITSE